MSRPRSKSPKWSRALSGVAVFALFAGMLFWTKLRMVSEIPRTAYAVPPEEQEPQTEGADPQIAEPDSDTEPAQAEGEPPSASTDDSTD